MKNKSVPCAILFFIVVGLTGCGAASVQKSMRSLSFGDDISIVYTAHAFSETPSLVQQVVYEKGDEIYEFTAMVDVRDASVTIAGLSSLGNRQFLLTMNDNLLTYDAEPLFELPFPPQYLMRDFMLVFAGRDELLRQQPGLTLSDEGQVRVVHSGEQQFVSITYEARGFVIGEVVLKHNAVGYTLRIATVQANVSSVVTQPSDDKLLE
ncbi:MAG: DUF3261 domain-containing protein [Deltaproteobacteria bacterium]|nr:DUF3261 domain-containing protein [Deltaproteobacteria bacterium]